MAIVGGQDDDELNNPNGGAKVGGTGGGGYVGGAAGGTGATTKTAGAPTSSGGGYTNLSSYLQANEGAGATTGQAAENVVGQAGATAKSAQKDFGDAAGAEIKGATDAAGVNQGVLDGIGYQGPDVGDSGAQSTDPTVGGERRSSNGPEPTVGGERRSSTAAPAANPYASFGLDGSNYSGYTQGLKGKADAANQQVYGYAGQANGGQAGVSALLKNAYQQPSYTAGENNLDSFLAGGTSGGKAALGQATGVAAGTEGGYKNLNAYLDGGIQNGKSTAAQTNAVYDDARSKKAAQDLQATQEAGIQVGNNGRRSASIAPAGHVDSSTHTTTDDPTAIENAADKYRKGAGTTIMPQLPDNRLTRALNPDQTDNMVQVADDLNNVSQPGNPLSAMGVPQVPEPTKPIDNALNRATGGGYGKLRKIVRF